MVSPADYYAWRDGARSFEGLSAWSHRMASVDFGAGKEAVRTVLTTANIFNVLRTNPVAGRVYDERRPYLPGSDCSHWSSGLSASMALRAPSSVSRPAKSGSGSRSALQACRSSRRSRPRPYGCCWPAPWSVWGAAWVGSGLFQSLVFDIDPSAALPYLIPFAVLICLGFVAAMGPAVRASRIDPLLVLRRE